jgi:hypothetical protein
MTWVEILTRGAVLSALLGAALFVGFYFKRSPWDSNRVGRSLMLFLTSVVAMLLVSTVSLFTGGDISGYDYLRLVTYGAVSYSIWNLFFTLVSIQNSPTPKR